MKRGLFILVLCLLVSATSACGGNSTNKQEETTKQNSTEINSPAESIEQSQLTISEETNKSLLQDVSSDIEASESGAGQNQSKNEDGEKLMQMKINDTAVFVEWENNESVQALKVLCTEKPLIIQMSMYGGFEQVGSIGTDLPRNDVQTTTRAGDIVLYSGNRLVVFYGSNSWAYTRLGHISGINGNELSSLLGNGNVTITLN